MQLPFFQVVSDMKITSLLSSLYLHMRFSSVNDMCLLKSLDLSFCGDDTCCLDKNF